METPTALSGQAPASTAVIAGCGDLGSQTGLRLAAGGYRVVGLRRNPDRVPDPIAGQAVDLRSEVPQLPPETAVVVIALTADTRDEPGYRETFVTGLGHLLDAIERQVPVPPRTLLVSSTAVYGVTDGAWVDESTPAVGGTATAGVLGIGSFSGASRNAEGPEKMDGGTHLHDPTLGSVELELEEDVDRATVDSWVAALLRERGEDVYRIKGLLAVRDDPRRFVLQGIHSMFETCSRSCPGRRGVASDAAPGWY